MEGKKLEEKKMALKKFDPALTAVALGQVLMAHRVEKADVAMAKEKIKELFKMLPADKDRAGIVNKALSEAEAEMVAEEVEKIKTELTGLSKEDLIEIDRALGLEVTKICMSYLLYCQNCVFYRIIGRCLDCINYYVGSPCQFCIHAGIICLGLRYMGGCDAAINVGSFIQTGDPAWVEKVVGAVVMDERLTKAVRKMVLEMKENKEI